MNKSWRDPRLLPSFVVDEEAQQFGGKAANLLALRRQGFLVPEFEVWPVQKLEQFLTHNGSSLAGLFHQAQVNSAEDEFSRFAFPEDMRKALKKVFLNLGEDSLCVRSSGTSEDLSDHSFAGQYESVVGINNFPDFLEGVKTCWLSLFQDRALSYFRERRISPENAGMGLIFQKYILGDFSGVTFTVNPLSGNQQHMLMEYCPGEGHQLVSGRVRPESVVYNQASEEVVSGNPPDKFDKSNFGLFRKVHAVFGSPQDIEWVMNEGVLYIVQSRPVTKISVERKFGIWTTADFRDGGVSSSVVTPFMWSLYDFVWQYTMPRYFEIIRLLEENQKSRKWGDVFFGRPYWNLGEVLHCLYKVPGFDEANFFSDLGIKTEENYPFHRIVVSLESARHLLPIVLSLEHYYKSRIKRNRLFRSRFPKIVAPFSVDLKGFSDRGFSRGFRRLIRKVYFLTESAYFFTIYNTSNAKLDFKVHLDLLNSGIEQFSYIKLISGLMKVKHLHPLKALANISRRIASIPGLSEEIVDCPADLVERKLASHPQGAAIQAEMDGFVQKFGYHSSRELDISIPRWEGDRETVWRILKTYLKSPDPESAVTHERRQHAMYREESARARKKFESLYDKIVPIQKNLFFKNLLRTRTYCWWREEMRDYSSRVYAIIRRFAVEAERRLGLPKDSIFWLTWQEVEMALDKKLSRSEMERKIEKASEEGAMYRFYRNPDELGAGLLTDDGGENLAGAEELVGIGCSPGKARGVARVLSSMDEIDKVQRGEILVTKFTDPGWTPVFHLLGGVVTETGGLLSHAAVISREYGIPSVLNVPGVTKKIRDGQILYVDGSGGRVQWEK